MVKKLFVVFALLGLAVGCSDKAASSPVTAEPTKPASASPSTSDCPYQGKGGFCFSPPAGTTPSESGSAVIIFKRDAEPKPAQNLAVRTEDFQMTPEVLKQNREATREGTGTAGTVVLEDVDIAGGKGFYIATQSSSNVLVTAIVPNGDKLYRCTFNAYMTDKAALKNEIQACKSLKAAN